MEWQTDVTVPSCEAVITALLVIGCRSAGAGGPSPGEPDRHQHAKPRGHFSTLRAAGPAVFAELDHLDDPATARLEGGRRGSLPSAWTARPGTPSSGKTPPPTPLHPPRARCP